MTPMQHFFYQNIYHNLSLQTMFNLRKLKQGNCKYRTSTIN